MSTKSFSNPAIEQEFRLRFEDRVRFNEPMAPLMAYRIGGPADILVFPKSEAELTWLADSAKRFGLPVTVVGTGTNLLVRDQGIRGITVALFNAFREIQPLGLRGDEFWVKAEGGVEKPTLLQWSIDQGLTGLEFSSGVPGTIGGGIFMNAGTKYGCYADILKELRLFDFEAGAKTVTRQDAHFGYRHQTAVKDQLVLSATFALKRGDTAAVRAERDRIIAERAEKQPLDFPSCGSTFKNPEGHSAGRLIEKSGLKGTRIGGAEISLKHANFILNVGNAKASDILALIGIIKTKVLEQFGVPLECEVIVLGDPDENQIPHKN